jgi:hypothetical protein
VNLSEVKRLHNPKPYSSPLPSRVQRNGQSWSNIQKDHSLTDTARGGCRRKDLALQSVCLSVCLSLSLPPFLPPSFSWLQGTDTKEGGHKRTTVVHTDPRKEGSCFWNTIWYDRSYSCSWVLCSKYTCYLANTHCHAVTKIKGKEQRDGFLHTNVFWRS